LTLRGAAERNRLDFRKETTPKKNGSKNRRGKK